MANETLIKPIVTIQAGADQASVESATVTLAIDRPPVAYIKFHPRTQGNEVIEALASSVATSMGTSQGALFRGQTKAILALNISAEVGDIGELQFDGLFSSPNYGVSTNNIAYSATLVHVSSLLNSLDLSIYRAEKNLWKIEAEDDVNLKSVNLGVRIAAVLKQIIATGIEFKDVDPRKQQVLLAIHNEVNAVGLPYFETILANTNVSMDAWTKIIELETNDVSDRINDHILAILRQNTGSFFTNLDSLAESFQLIFVPDLDGLGKFITRASAVTDTPTVSINALSGMSLSTGSQTMQPITNVICYNVNGNTYKINSNERVGSVYAYPDTLVGGGRVLSVAPPPYIGYIAPTGEVENPVENIDIDDYEKSRRKLYAAGLKASKAYEDILRDYCRNIYCQTALADATASCQVPLNLNLKPGMRCQVSSAGVKLFTGFLRQVTHSINGNRAGPHTATQLDFNLVEAGNFTLPFKNE
jgi:hypothetical protein